VGNEDSAVEVVPSPWLQFRAGAFNCMTAFRLEADVKQSMGVWAAFDPFQPLGFSVEVVKSLLIPTRRFGLHTQFGC